MSKSLSLPNPVVIRLRGQTAYRDYPYSYSVSLSRLRSRVLRDDLLLLGRSLRCTSIGDELVFFDRLFSDGINGAKLRFLFAGLRSALVEITGDPFSALHVPLESTDTGDFPLHADLFRPSILFNVYDCAERGESGASTFLAARDFLRIAKAHKSIPSSAQNRMRDLLRGEMIGDGFDRFFDLLYGRRRPWANSLSLRMRSYSLQIKLESGQGYMLRDRKWLHGRLPVEKRVGTSRLQRLIFDSVVSS
jgi:hypothetical protein